ncbi:hypothetical protein BJ875DRAFT_482570 [Amylocarpus encephaloides]|uniref:Uncharacterized protein n=1 Tax=Amylocarpus encephaloides TaxID=45428 RepID=A0A9P8C8I7_9HELO|nr:hypothetical protein BJ875DRAFT_482570 [Amylocarpus encephaloides]
MAIAVLAVASQATPAASTDLPVGAFCNRYLDNACADGVECFTLMSDGKDQCGGYMADCDYDSQCMSSECGGPWGYCVRASVSTATRTTTTTTNTRSTPVSSTPTPVSSTLTPVSSTLTPTGGLPLGASCSPLIDNQCANGANCYATNSALIPRCGNFQASCTSNAQCAFNTCSDGLCDGFLAPRSTVTATKQGRPTTTPIASNSTIVVPIRGPDPTAPEQNNEVAQLGGSLTAVLAVAALVALVL